MEALMTNKLGLTSAAVTARRFVLAAALCAGGQLGCQGPGINRVDIDLGIINSGDLAGTAPQAFFRVGHFLVGPGPFDICIKGPSDADFSGPLVRQQAQRAGGITYANVSTYLTVAPTSYTVRAVPGAALDCKTSIGGLPDLAVTPLSLGRHYTVVASGVTSRLSSVKFNLIEDDLSTQGGQARLRFINGSADLPSAELGFGSGAQYAPQLTSATYGGIGFANGQPYLTTAPLINATIAVRQSGVNMDALVIPNKANVAVGTVATAVIAGVPGDPFTPLSLVLCDDSAPAISGLASCTELP
jgi:hypothetical protein